MYILLTKENMVSEIIPDEDPVFPGVPVSARYAPEFVRGLLQVDNETAVAEGWTYSPETGLFSPPPDVTPGDTDQYNLATLKVIRIQQSKDDLEAYLEAHPITWTDGKQYSITRERQQQLTSKILSATLAHQTSTPYELTWNATGAECTPWTLEELAALAFAIDARVTALVSYQQAKEVAMREAATLEELEGVNVDYDEVS